MVLGNYRRQLSWVLISAMLRPTTVALIYREALIHRVAGDAEAGSNFKIICQNQFHLQRSQFFFGVEFLRPTRSFVAETTKTIMDDDLRNFFTRDEAMG